MTIKIVKTEEGIVEVENIKTTIMKRTYNLTEINEQINMAQGKVDELKVIKAEIEKPMPEVEK